MKSAASESEECFHSDPNYVEVTALEQERFALQVPKDSLKHLILAESEEFKHFSLGHSSIISAENQELKLWNSLQEHQN